LKKLLLLLLLIPNLVMADKVLYCQDELATGIIKRNGVWETSRFQLERYTIKFNDDYTELDGFDNVTAPNETFNCNTPYLKKNMIKCTSSSFQDVTFIFDKITKRYTFSFITPFSYIENGSDTSSLSAGTCKAF